MNYIRDHSNNFIAAIVFVLCGIMLTTIVPSIAIGTVVWILLLTVYLFIFEIVTVDVAALSIMVLIGSLTLIGPYIGLITPLVPADQLFVGFSSNAVMSIIAVMIIGAGLDKTGIMGQVAGLILKIGGKTQARIIPMIAGSVGIISSFMQNVGAAALFLPVVSRISVRTDIPLSRLLMPMGFTAILGGTVTMVGSSPLIMLNDLILTSNKGLPVESRMETFSLFAVTPVGVALLITGVAFFVLVGRFILPNHTSNATTAISTMEHFKSVYQLEYDLVELKVPEISPLAGKTIDDIENANKVRIVALGSNNKLRIDNIARDTIIEAGDHLGVLASQEALLQFINHGHLKRYSELVMFSESLAPTKAGIAELVLPPGSSLVGKTPREIWMRKTYGISPLAIHRHKATIREGEGVRDECFRDGDTLICHINWHDLHRLESNRDFVLVTSEYPHEALRPKKLGFALFFFGVALGLILFSDARLSIALLIGAIGMILTGVVKMGEAYKAISWPTVFLVASLIPLGMAVETSGTAAWIAKQILILMDGWPLWMLQAAMSILATIFTLVMSNVGATVLLVPLAINIAIGAGANPAVFALTVAIATSNAFLIPTHQVNALIMGPGGYRVSDFIKAGGIMSILFWVVMNVALNILY